MCVCVCLSLNMFVLVRGERVPWLCRSSNSLDQIYLPFMQTGNGTGCPHDSSACH